LSSDRITCFIFSSEIWTPVVLENPGLELYPADFTAKGVLVEPIILMAAETSFASFTSTTHKGVWDDDDIQCEMARVNGFGVVLLEDVEFESAGL
tara:strand:- start:38 stop:322 length:285 start_codon:yes stop_codon:yes gene_type:complete